MNTPSPDSPQNVCPKCGRPIPEGSPRGLCPLCLISEVAKDESPSAPVPEPELEDLRRAFPTLEIIEVLGAGGMGRVYKVRQPHLDRFGALKLLPPGLADDPAWVERFTREARALARLNHPGIVQVYDFGEASSDSEQGTAKKFPFLLMEYVDGVNLRQALRGGSLTAAEALAIVPPMCAALQYAHEQGVLHRDIKPENILLDTDGRVKIADFGVAKLAGAPGSPGATLTATGAQLGTAAYMAPEQIERPQDVDHRADIYSLGVVFYELLTGELPLGRFPAPSEKAGTDPRLDTIVFRTLEKERERRFQTAGEVKTEVEHVTSSEPPPMPAVSAAAAPPSPAGSPAPLASRKTVALVLSLVMLPLLLIGLALLWPMGARGGGSWANVTLGALGVMLVGAALVVVGFTWLFRRLQRAGVSTAVAAVIVALGLIIIPPVGCIGGLLVPALLGYRSAQRVPGPARQFQLQLDSSRMTGNQVTARWKITSQTPLWATLRYGDISQSIEPRASDGRFIVDILATLDRRIAPNTSSFTFAEYTLVGERRRVTRALFQELGDTDREFPIAAVDPLYTLPADPITLMRIGDVPFTVTVSGEPQPVENKVQLTVRDVSLSDENGDLVLNVDFTANDQGNAELYFKEDGLAKSNGLVKSTMFEGMEMLPLKRRVWKLPASLDAASRKRLEDRIESQYLQKTIAVPRDQSWEFFQVRSGDGTIGSVSIGARERSLEPR